MQQYPEKKKKTTPTHLPRYILVGMVMFLVGFIAGIGTILFTTTDSPRNVYPTVQAYPSPTPIVYAEIVIALQNIPCGYPIPESAVGLVPYPVEVLPFAGVYKVEDVIGKLARTDLYREMPLLYNTLTDDPKEISSTCES